MFVGRKNEREELERAYQTDHFSMPIVYGRRRVGKTRLLREFSRNKECIFFTAVESTKERNLELFSSAIYRTLAPDLSGVSAFQRFEDAFQFIYERAKERKLLCIIDEYPYLAGASKEISSIFQTAIDGMFSQCNMMLILCGSSMSFMEEQVLGYQSPLYGRRTEQYRIRPLSYRESAEFVSGYSEEDKALVYGFTGGIPKYLELIDEKKSVRENIIGLFLKENGYLYEEPANLLKQELRDPYRYNSIIEAIANGYTKLSEISSRVKLDSATVAHCLDKLISLGIISKEMPVVGKNNKRKVIYSVEDSMFRFWYKFVPGGLDAILSGDGEYLYDEIIQPHLSAYMGYVFETMARQFIMEQNKKNKLPLHVLTIGKWWGSNPVKKTEEEIDLVAVNTVKKEILFGECKYTNKKPDMGVLKTLLERAELVTDYEKRYYVLFSKSGFTEEVRKSEGVMLVTMDDMYE